MDIFKNLIPKIPKEVSYVTDTLEKAGFEAYLVGGCVRDLAMSQILNETEGNRIPKDWDVATNAKPEQIMALFEKTIYENDFGTVIVCVPCETNNIETSYMSTKVSTLADETSKTDVSQETFFQIEVTPYRIEAKYVDFRHPDEVKFSDKLEDDLKRRDFTINAMAFRNKGQNSNITDMFGGLKDIKDKVL